jgi:branched-chain amino acid transport system substrate-binding protein
VFSEPTGYGSVVAAQMAARDFGGKVGNKKIEIIYADHQNKADVAVSIALQWFDRDHVDAIADLGNSAVALAVADIARKRNKVVLISAGGTTDLTGKDCSPNTVQWTYDTWSQAAPLVETMMKQGKKDWYFISADYTFGANLQEEASKALEAAGGRVVGSVRHPLNTNDFSSYLLQAKASGAQVIALANGGGDTARAVKQANEFGISKSQTVVGLSLLIDEIHALGLPSTHGLMISDSFYWDLNDATRAFSKRWSAQMKGKMPSMMQAGVYSVVRDYLRALSAGAPADDGRAVVEKMKAAPDEDPLFGNSVVRADGRVLHNVYVFQVKSPVESKYPWDYLKLIDTVPGDKAFRPLAEGGCPLIH